MDDVVSDGRNSIVIDGDDNGSNHFNSGNIESKFNNDDYNNNNNNDNNNDNMIGLEVKKDYHRDDDDSESDDEYYQNNENLTVDHSDLKGVEKKFAFYNFGGDDVPFDSILRTIKTLPNEFQYMSDNYHNISRKQSSSLLSNNQNNNQLDYNRFSIKDFQKTHFDTNKKNHTISQFKEKPIIWDASAPDKELMDSLYRIPQSDPSGKLILSLSRDEAKGVKAWKQPEKDRDFGYPDANSYSDSFRHQLIKHMEQVVKQVEQEHKKLPEKTQAQSNLKASVGADLNDLRRKQEAILQSL